MFVRKSDPHAAILREYMRLAPVYDARWSFYVNATVHETLRRIEVRPGESLLEVGCGTGVLLQCLHDAYPTVSLTGVDPCAAMIERARVKVGRAVELKEAWAESLPFDSESFDAVVLCNVFHYLPRPTDALGQITCVLKPGGRLVITDWCDDYFACKVCDLCLRLFSTAHYKTYGSRDCVALLARAGFIEAHIERYKINWLWGLMTATSRRAPETSRPKTEPASVKRHENIPAGG